MSAATVSNIASIDSRGYVSRRSAAPHYQDDLSQRRWALKLKDPKTISEIDAVFVTVEPQGGSPKPSGKPLLFTYLRIDPNHP